MDNTTENITSESAPASAPMFATRAQETATNFADTTIGRFDPVASGDSAPGLRTTSFADRIIDNFWGPSSLFGSVAFGVSSLMAELQTRQQQGNQRAASAPNWVFTDPWYQDELDWLRAAYDVDASGLDTAGSAAMTRPFAGPIKNIPVTYVAPSLSGTVTKPAMAMPAGLAGHLLSDEAPLFIDATTGQEMLDTAPSQTTPGIARQQKTATPIRGRSLLSQNNAISAVASATPEAVGHIAWADRWLGKFAGASDQAADSMISSVRAYGGTPSIAYVAPSFDGEADAVTAPALSRVVDDGEGLSEEEIAAIVSPRKPRKMFVPSGIRQSRAESILRQAPKAAAFAGIGASLAASPLAPALLGVTELPHIDSFDTRSLSSMPVIDGQGQTIWVGSQDLRTAELAPQREFVGFSAPDSEWGRPGQAGLRAQKFSMETESGAADLSYDFVAPEMMLAAKQYGFSAGQAAQATRLSLVGPQGINRLASSVDLTFLSAMDDGSSKSDDKTSSTFSGDAFGVGQKPPRGVYMWPQAALESMDLPNINDKQPFATAALDLLAAKSVADSREYAVPTDGMATGRTEQFSEVYAAIAQTPAGRSMSPSVRAARAMAVMTQVASVPSDKKMEAVWAILPQVFAGDMPKVAPTEDSNFVQGSAGEALRSFVAPPGVDYVSDDAHAPLTPVLRAPAVRHDYVKPIEAPAPKQAAAHEKRIVRKQTLIEAGGPQIPKWFEAAAKAMFAKGKPAEEMSSVELTLIAGAANDSGEPVQMAAKGADETHVAAAPAVTASNNFDEAATVKKVVAKVFRELERLRGRTQGA